jgi:hypothetical protein
MEKLELKHLVGYLPYGLRGITAFLPNTIFIIDGIVKDRIKGFTESGNNVPLGCGLVEFKPILRPLSDLTKEIEVNGEKFVPIGVLLNIALKNVKKEKELEPWYDSNSVCFSAVVKTKKGCLNISFDHTDNSFVMINEGRTICVPNQLELFEKLYEWHFDIHGLIENGLAIDINTI